MNIDKLKIISDLIQLEKEHLNRYINAYEMAREASIKAEGRMQSRYDTQKIEASYLANTYASMIENIKTEINQIQSISIPNSNNKIEVGHCALVATIDDKTPKEEIYFILPTGITCSTYGDMMCDVIFVSLSSPIGSALLSKKEGDILQIKLPIGSKKVKVLSIF